MSEHAESQRLGAGGSSPGTDRRSRATPPAVGLAGTLRRLQSQAGNAAVQRLLTQPVQRALLSEEAVEDHIDRRLASFSPNRRSNANEGCRPDWIEKDTSDAVSQWWLSTMGGETARVFNDQRHRDNTQLGIPSLNLERGNRAGFRFIYHAPAIQTANDRKILERKLQPAQQPAHQPPMGGMTGPQGWGGAAWGQGGGAVSQGGGQSGSAWDDWDDPGAPSTVTTPSQMGANATASSSQVADDSEAVDDWEKLV